MRRMVAVRSLMTQCLRLIYRVPESVRHSGNKPGLTPDNWRNCECSMNARAILAVILMLLMLAPAAATVRIGDDGGGQIGTYLAKYRALRASGERVEIDGTCASACTMLLGVIPRNRICVTPRASLVFHSAWDAQADQAVAADGNRILWSNYPESVRQWIKRHGGLRDQVITLRGPELMAMFPACR